MKRVKFVTGLKNKEPKLKKKLNFKFFSNFKSLKSLPIITPEQWKPATKVQHVLASLIGML